MEKLKQIGIDWEGTRLKYMNQKIKIRVNRENTGCVDRKHDRKRSKAGMLYMSPLVFNIYSKKLTEEALNGTQRIVIEEYNVKTVKYTGNTAILAKKNTLQYI